MLWVHVVKVITGSLRQDGRASFGLWVEEEDDFKGIKYPLLCGQWVYN